MNFHKTLISHALMVSAVLLGSLFFSLQAHASEYASPLKHQPYVQLGNAPLTGYDGGKDQFEIMWQTVPPTSSSTDSFTAEYKAATSSTWIDAGAISTINTGIEYRVNHYVTITGLQWGTDYDYHVLHIRNGSTLATYSATYHTRLQAGVNTPFTFVAYGDSASGNPPTNFMSVQSRINTVAPAFSILLGDNVYTDGTQAEWDLRLDQSINSTATDYIKNHIDYFGWGNHDIISNSGQPVLDNYDVPRPSLGVTSPVAAPVGETAEHNYSFDYGNVHFVEFDTNSYTDSTRLGKQLTWAVADLNASSARWKVVFVHFPIISVSFTSTGPSSNYYQQMVSQLKAAGADVLFVGHAHVYERSFPLTGQSGSTALITDTNDNDYAKGGGLTEIVSGLGGRDFHAGNTTPSWLVFAMTSQLQYNRFGSAPAATVFSFTKIDVTQNQMTISQIKPSDGSTIDSFTLTAGISATNVEPASLVAGTAGNATVSFTNSTTIPSDGKIVVTLPTSLGSGFVLNSGGTTAASSGTMDGSFSASVSSNVLTLTRSGGSSTAPGAQTITLTHIKNPDVSGSTGTYQIKTTDSSSVTIEEDTAVTADTITPATLTSTNVEPASLTASATGNVTVSFTVVNPLPSNGKISVTFPTSLGSGYVISSGGTTAASSLTGIDGSLSASIASNVITLTRSGGTTFSSGAVSFVLSNIKNPDAGGSTGVYQIKTLNSASSIIDQDTSVTTDSIAGAPPSNWWNNSWTYRTKITFDNSGQAENLTSVPVMIALNSSRINYNNTKALGADIRFVDSDNATSLPYEIEKWDTSATSTIWVKVPQIDASSATDYIYVYYGNNAASDAQATSSVWTNKYEAVYHFAETSGAYIDSSGYANNSDAQTLSSRSTTLLGNAPTFGGTTSHFITIPDSNYFNNVDYTVEAYVKSAGAGTAIMTGSTALTSIYPVVTKGMAEADTAAADIHFFLGLNSTGTVGSDFEDSTVANNNAQTSGTTTLTTSGTTAYYLASTVTAGTGGSNRIYINGALDASSSLPISGQNGITPNVSGTMKVGIGTALKTDNSVNGGFNGVIDEVRISSTTRSTNWLKLQYKSIVDTLNTYASAENVSGVGNLSSTSVTPASLTVGASGNVTVAFTTGSTLASDGKIVVTLPTSLAGGFTVNDSGTTAVSSVSGFDGSLTLSVASNVLTLTRSGGSSATAGAKSFILSHIKNPIVAGSSGVYIIKTTTSADATVEQDTSVGASTIAAGALSGTNVEPASLATSGTGSVTVSFTTLNPIPSDGKIVVTFPTSLGSGFTLSSGGTTAASSATIGGTLTVSTSSNVLTITRSGSATTSAAVFESITLTNIKNPTSAGSTGTYQIKTTDASGNIIDQDTAVTADTISTSGATAGWWDASWTYRKKITFNNVAQSANLVNFPVRVVLSTTTTTYANFNSSGNDVRFIDADGTTQLNYEIENWNTSSTSNLWVKVPQIDASSATDYIYMYYGNSGAAAVATTTGVWDSNYKAVHHFGQTSGNYLDSTSRANNSDSVTSVTRTNAVTGSIGYVAQFAGGNSTSYVTLPDSADWDMYSYTVEAYVRQVGAGTTVSTGSTGQSAIYPIISKGMAEAETTAADVQFFMGVTSGSLVGGDYENDRNTGGLSENAPLNGTSTVSSNTWYHLAIAFDDANDTWRIYKNGYRENGISTTTKPSTGGTQKVGIGTATKAAGVVSAGGGFNGQIDEIRISSTTRSESWITASYLSIIDGYNTYASEENVGAGTLTSTNVEPATLVASAVGTTTVTFTTINSVASTGKIVITFPTSLDSGFALNSGGTTVASSTGFDGTLTVSTSGNVLTITRSGGTTATAGAKTIQLSYIRNPGAAGSTGVYAIKTTTSADSIIDQDLAVSADTITAASLTSTNVEPGALTQATNTSVTVSFTTTDNIPANGKIKVTFPTSLGSGFTFSSGGTTAASSASGISGTFTLATTSNTVTITRVGDGNVATPGAKSFILSNIKTPNAAGSTGLYQIQTLDSANTVIDQDTSVSADTIIGNLTSTNVEPASLSASASGNVTVSFTTANSLANTGKIVVTFPTSLGSGFTFSSGGTTAAGSASGIDGTFSISTTSNTVTITRAGDGTTSTAGAKSIVLSNIKNPNAPGSTGTYALYTKTSVDVIIDQDTAVSADNISSGALTSTNVEPASLVAGATGNVTVSFTTANPIPVDGSIYIYMPQDLGNGYVLDSGGTTGITSVSGIDGTFTISNSNNFVTVTRVGDGTISTAGAKSFVLTHIKNPDQTGTVSAYTIETRNSSTIDLDRDMAVSADTFTAGALTSTNIQPADLHQNAAGDVVVSFTTANWIPSSGKIVLTFPTSLGSGFTFNSGGTTAATSATFDGSLSVSIASNVLTITRSLGTDAIAGSVESITLSHIQNPSAVGSTGTYSIVTKTSDSSTIDQDTSVSADTITDFTAPTVSMTAPSDTTTVSGSSVTLSANASDNVAVAGVSFKVDGALIQSEDTTSTYGVSWDSTSVIDGSHTLVAVARDAANNRATSTAVTVTVDNTAPVRSSGSPSGTLSSVTTGATLSLATDEAATCKYSTSPGTAYSSMTAFGTTGSVSHSSSISGLSHGNSYNYYVKCRDGQTNTNATDYTISFTVAPDTSVPTVSLDVPADGAVVTGSSVTLSASASDDIAVSGVSFKVDGILIQSEDTTSAYGISWDSTSVSDGIHALSAVARDSSGNLATSTSVGVTVDNTAPVRSAGSPSGSLAYGTTGTTLSLTTNETATCKYSASSGTAYGSMTVFSTTNSTSHSTSISGLSDGNSYTYYVKCRDGQANTNATDYTISFTVATDTDAPGISSISSGTPTDTGTTITWTTDENTSSRILLGITSSLGSSTPETNTSPRVASHSVTLPGLKPCTLYYYAVQSRDAALNTASSTVDSFTTTGCTGSAAIENVAAENIPSNSGGTIDLIAEGKGPELTIPPSYAGSTNADFQIKKVEKVDTLSVTGLPAGLSLTSDHIYDFKAYSDTTTLVTSFSQPITITISYTSDDLSGITESTLTIKRFDSVAWEDLDSCTINTNARTVSCTTTSFSVFGLFGEAAAVSSSPSSSSSSSGGGSAFISNIPKPVIPASLLVTRFTKALSLGSRDPQVKLLQIVLNSDPKTIIALSGAGSPGHETVTFLAKTLASVKKFQLKYKIVKSTKDPGYGLVGPATRKKLNELLH